MFFMFNVILCKMGAPARPWGLYINCCGLFSPVLFYLTVQVIQL